MNGRAREPDQRHAVEERFLDESHRLEHERHRLFDVDAREATHILRAPHGTMDARAIALGELESDAQRLEHEQDVGEQDRRVDPEPLDGLERHLRRRVRVLAELEEAMAGTHGAVFRHVAPRLTHEPYRRERRHLSRTGL